MGEGGVTIADPSGPHREERGTFASSEEANKDEKTVVHWTSHFYPLLGGVPSHIDSICTGLTGFQHLVVTNRLLGTAPRERFRPNAEILRFGPADIVRSPPRGMGYKVIVPIASVADFVRGFRQRRFLDSQESAILHVHDIEWNLIQLDTATRLNIGGYIVRALYSPPDGIPALITKHFLFPPEAPEKLRYWERVLTLQFPTIVCVDRGIEEEVRKWAEEERLTRNIIYLPNGVDLSRFAPKPLPPFDRLRVGFVARLDALRGESFLIDFLSHLPDFVEFYGALATDAARFETLRSEFRSDRIHLQRNVIQDRLPNFYAGIHVLINPLTVEYAVTRSALEAMGCGRCVIMFGSNPRPPLVHRETAFFVPSTLDGVIRLLRELHQHPGVIEEIGMNARRAVERAYSTALVLPPLERLYRSLLTRGA